MARIPYPNVEDLPEKVRVAAEKLPPLNIMKMFLNAPTNAIPLLVFGQSILTKQELDDHLRELAILRVAHLTGANYEWTQHVPLAKETGVTDAQVEALPQGADSDAFNEVEKNVIRFTDEVTQDVKASAETFAALEKDLGPRQMVELTPGHWFLRHGGAGDGIVRGRVGAHSRDVFDRSASSLSQSAR